MAGKERLAWEKGMGYGLRTHYRTRVIGKIQLTKITMKSYIRIPIVFFALALIMLPAIIGGAGGSPRNLSREIAEYSRGKNIVCLKLKNKGEINGVITNYTACGLTLDIGFGTTVIANSDIEKITPQKDSKKRKKHIDPRSAEKKENQKKRETEDVFKRIEAAERIKQESLKKQNMITDIRFEDKSRIQVNALLNDTVSIRLIVDTGANVVSIPPHAARKLGIQLSRKNAVSVKLADGSMGQAIPVTLKSLKVGNAEALNVKAVVAIGEQGKPQTVGLLGMSFLNGFHVKLDTDKNILTLIKK
ncbi:MAG: retroviral-like aspartic protease family protein [Candidatus Omnitrophica bacterium]|nr:retroviral-like aspartic protease family protein [Candidatus Omnitrophota bacterium]MBU1128899.1 retroviral-like aspartic protease family protein [Candidatus Omnitrophota bacterium]MBU1852024.1 retroviral-like aspartic protease family protein [Candidatus Omnitrophota bacterium]